MVKQKPSTNHDRNMNDYKMRTHYAGSTNYARQNNRVQVAHSKGCCSSKKPVNNPSRPVVRQEHQRPAVRREPQQPEQTPQTAHDRAHLRLDQPEPFYSRHGRIKKNPNRTKKKYQPQYRNNQVHTTEPPTTNFQQMNTNRNYRPVQGNTNRNYQPVQSTTKKSNCCCAIL